MLLLNILAATPQRTACPNQGHFQVTGVSWNGMRTTESCDSVEVDENGMDRGAGVNSLAVGCSGLDSMNIRVQSHTKLCNRMAYSAGWNIFMISQHKMKR